MNEIEKIKAFAELEGVKGAIENAIRRQQANYHSFMRGGTSGESSPAVQAFDSIYNPITDLALNCKARDKYGVMIVYHFKKDKFYVSCYNGLEHVEVDLNSDIPRAVIECILKSKGLYHE